MMRCEVFTDPIYNAERFVEFEPSQVVSVEEKDIRLLPRRKFRVTLITLSDGSQHLLAGEQAARIEEQR